MKPKQPKKRKKVMSDSDWRKQSKNEIYREIKEKFTELYKIFSTGTIIRRTLPLKQEKIKFGKYTANILDKTTIIVFTLLQFNIIL